MRDKLISALIILAPLSSSGERAEEKIVAQTILAEARGEGDFGMYAVASVIKTRSQNRGISFGEVCKEPFQFSCWNTGDPNRAKMDRLMSLPQARYALFLARNMDRVTPSLIGGADHYLTVKLHRTGRIRWARGAKPVARVNSHVFFRLNEPKP